MSNFRSAATCLAALGTRQVATRPWITTADREVPFSALSDRVGRVAALLHRRGVKVGERVVIATADDCEAALLFVAMICNGITAVLLDPLTGADRARSLIHKAKPALIIVDADLSARWALSGSNVIEIAAVAAGGGMFGGLMRAKPTEGLHAELASLTPQEPPQAIPEETLAYILFTSGTTKDPKGVCISHKALFSHLGTLSRIFGYSDGSRILNTLMLSHADGIIQGPMITFFNAAQLYRPVNFEITTLDRLLDSVFQRRISHMVAVPTMLSLMARLSHHQTEAFEGGDFQFMISCGAALEAALWSEFESKFGVTILNVYGLTETVVGGVFAGPGLSRSEQGSIGLPVDCELKILDDGAGQGELLMKGDLLMSGYFDDPAQTSEVLRDGWLHTGDVARQDEDGLYWICGRKKNIVIRGGLNISPEEVSEALNGHPQVHEAVAFGAPDSEWGEKLFALVVAPEATESSLLQYCATVLEPRKIPNRIVIVDGLPKGRSGKVKLEDARALLDQPDTVLRIETGLDTEARLLAVAARTFSTNVSQLRLSSTPKEVLGWDSLAHLNFVAALEQEFQVTLTPRQIMRLTRIGAALDLVS